jgi:hypothetical protein
MGENFNENGLHHIDHFSKRVPPGVSPYFVGIAFLLTTFISSFAAAWFAISGDVRQYMENQKEIRLQEIAQKTSTLADKDDEIRRLRTEFSELLHRYVQRENCIQQSPTSDVSQLQKSRRP